MRITVDVPLVDKPVYNVIGTIFGKDEPGKPHKKDSASFTLKWLLSSTDLVSTL